MAEHIREILVEEQDHQIDLATALGMEVPNVNKPAKKAGKKNRSGGRCSSAPPPYQDGGALYNAG